jgi:hypothetical protein
MDVSYVLLCDHAVPSAGQQKASFIGLFQQINAPQLPLRIPRFFIVFEVAGESVEAGAFEIGLRIQDEDGGDLININGSLTPKPSGGKRWQVNHVIGVENMEIKKTGGHQVLVLINRELKKSIRFDVIHTPQT